jgi:hypothetical protein
VTDEVGHLADQVLIATLIKQRDLKFALRRAYVALRELETSRRSEDIERVRHGVMHELETALRALGIKPEDIRPDTDHKTRSGPVEQLSIDDETET